MSLKDFLDKNQINSSTDNVSIQEKCANYIYQYFNTKKGSDDNSSVNTGTLTPSKEKIIDNNNSCNINTVLNEEMYLDNEIEEDVKKAILKVPTKKQIGYFVELLTENSEFTEEMIVYAFCLIEKFLKKYDRQQKNQQQQLGEDEINSDKKMIKNQKQHKRKVAISLKKSVSNQQQQSKSGVIQQIQEQCSDNNGSNFLSSTTFRPLIIVSIFVVQKYLNDEFFSAGYFSRIYPIFSKNDLIAMEESFLKYLDYNIHIKEKDINEFYEQLFNTRNKSSSLNINQTTCHYVKGQQQLMNLNSISQMKTQQSLQQLSFHGFSLGGQFSAQFLSYSDIEEQSDQDTE